MHEPMDAQSRIAVARVVTASCCDVFSITAALSHTTSRGLSLWRAPLRRKLAPTTDSITLRKRLCVSWRTPGLVLDIAMIAAYAIGHTRWPLLIVFILRSSAPVYLSRLGRHAFASWQRSLLHVNTASRLNPLR